MRYSCELDLMLLCTVNAARQDTLVVIPSAARDLLLARSEKKMEISWMAV